MLSFIFKYNNIFRQSVYCRGWFFICKKSDVFSHIALNFCCGSSEGRAGKAIICLRLSLILSDGGDLWHDDEPEPYGHL